MLIFCPNSVFVGLTVSVILYNTLKFANTTLPLTYRFWLCFNRPLHVAVAREELEDVEKIVSMMRAMNATIDCRNYLRQVR